jgi:hypothetical protein
MPGPVISFRCELSLQRVVMQTELKPAGQLFKA